MKVQKKNWGGGVLWGGGGEGSGWRGWGQGGCDQRIEVFGKIQKKNLGGSWGGGSGWGGGGSGWM